MRATVVSIGHDVCKVIVQLARGSTLPMYNKEGFALRVGSIVGVSALHSDPEIKDRFCVHILPKQPSLTKYYRAKIAGDDRINFMDAVGYTNKEKFATDLRGNGYKVSHIVQITSTFEMKPDVFEKGSVGFK